ncbi:hypothetical protein DIPPA_29115 [Diplonema papillatum]|nr:hypothetical protein DIPPA_29115 [Diplonema papillatum]
MRLYPCGRCDDIDRTDDWERVRVEREASQQRRLKRQRERDEGKGSNPAAGTAAPLPGGGTATPPSRPSSAERGGSAPCAGCCEISRSSSDPPLLHQQQACTRAPERNGADPKLTPVARCRKSAPFCASDCVESSSPSGDPQLPRSRAPVGDDGARGCVSTATASPAPRCALPGASCRPSSTLSSTPSRSIRRPSHPHQKLLDALSEADGIVSGEFRDLLHRRESVGRDLIVAGEEDGRREVAWCAATEEPKGLDPGGSCRRPGCGEGAGEEVSVVELMATCDFLVTRETIRQRMLSKQHDGSARLLLEGEAAAREALSHAEQREHGKLTLRVLAFTTAVELLLSDEAEGDPALPAHSVAKLLFSESEERATRGQIVASATHDLGLLSGVFASSHSESWARQEAGRAARAVEVEAHCTWETGCRGSLCAEECCNRDALRIAFAKEWVDLLDVHIWRAVNREAAARVRIEREADSIVPNLLTVTLAGRAIDKFAQTTFALETPPAACARREAGWRRVIAREWQEGLTAEVLDPFARSKDWRAALLSEHAARRRIDRESMLALARLQAEAMDVTIWSLANTTNPQDPWLALSEPPAPRPSSSSSSSSAEPASHCVTRSSSLSEAGLQHLIGLRMREQITAIYDQPRPATPPAPQPPAPDERLSEEGDASPSLVKSWAQFAASCQTAAARSSTAAAAGDCDEDDEGDDPWRMLDD